MFFVCFLFSFALSFLFFLFSFYYKKRLHKQQHPQDEQGKSQNEPALSNPSLSHKNAQTRENDSTHFPHSLLLEILPSDSTQWADLFTGQSCSGSQVKPQLVCLYPFTSTSSATQRKIKQQYDQLVKCHGNKGLTLAQVGEFANCLIEARNDLQHKSEVIKRKFTITNALLFKAERSSFDRLRQQIYKLEMEQKRLEEDAFVYNWLQEQLKLSPAYKKMLEIGACMELKAKSGEQMEGADTEISDISFEELLAQEKKDSFCTLINNLALHHVTFPRVLPFSFPLYFPFLASQIFISTPEKMSNDDASDLGVALPAAAAALSAEERAGLNKLQNLAGEHADVLETLSPNVRKRVEVLREIQELRIFSFSIYCLGNDFLLWKSEHDELEKKFFEERAALEAKYQKLYEPLYTKRYEIVNGIVKVEGETNEAVMDEEGDKCVEEKGVPDFWQTAMKMNEILAEEISERDEGALKYLKDIKWSRNDDPKGFKLEFFFDSNPFFKNTVLTKTYHMVDDENEPILEKAIGTKIEWYPGKCLTQKVLKKKPKKGSKNAKPITKTENCESFFNFFNPPQIPEDDDIDDELAEELQDRMEHDYNIGSAIRDKLIPHAVSWFTGEAGQGNEYDGLEKRKCKCRPKSAW
ncbi:hypothetical protein GOBAR_AA25725 [Gossypium barbadense]|uniref:Uncharacterized protein n=1 Tax=Gossypium barbadense TaxID=3634 RepID=A0A2P5WV42_GOSBA|nr:hypothetical protein GOBAR_AA25725 [Gossypium barbadense]